ncbi:hypothetical protein G9P44_002431 [Scheffersomyces stipitis]|nr:hypothetical protein G9P44_002431 [Scheffersomyces stipitis]
MPKYYCDYCNSYLTHDTMSVRKSHLIGRNHIKYYCTYYETKAKETGIWNPDDLVYEVTFETLNRAAPGSAPIRRKHYDHDHVDVSYKTEETDGKDSEIDAKYREESALKLPPPPNLTGFPNPPPSIFHYAEEYKKAIAKYKEQS